MAENSLEKKAISPLMATLLLVAFSVALGAVVMNWGESYVEQKADFVQGVREVLSACDAVSVNILKLAGTPQICNRGSTVELTLDNGQDQDIYDFNARIVGDAGTYTAESILVEPLKKLDAVKTTIKYPDTVGVPKQLKLVPKVKSGNDVIFCKNQNIIVEGMVACK